MPDGAIFVGRPSRWGNPVSLKYGSKYAVDVFSRICHSIAEEQGKTLEEWVAPLRGHDLVCWCPLDQQPCHADILLAISNS